MNPQNRLTNPYRSKDRLVLRAAVGAILEIFQRQFERMSETGGVNTQDSKACRA
jgi:hypothetical protein